MRQSTCSIDGCEGRADVPGTARGWCSKHYATWQRNGDPLAKRPRPRPTAERNAKLSAALTGRKLSPEHVAKIRTHGRSRDPNYGRHVQMLARCYNPASPSYEYYGARGIRVHQPWHDVTTFCNWLAANLGACPPRHSLDRIDNDGNYEPGNVRWASNSQQKINRRPAPARDGYTCAMCGEPFAAKRSDAMYCSARCRDAGRPGRKSKRGSTT